MKEKTLYRPPLPSKKILILDLFTNLGWIAGNFITSPFVGSAGNLGAVVTSKAFIAGILIAILGPI